MANRDNSTRLHAFDNARAALMWLGIVLHVCVNHLSFPTPIPWKDPQVSVGADLVFMAIHTFRMPAFFLLSAFFAAMIVDTRGADGMIGNRLRRLALPFAIFWPLLIVGMGFLAMNYAHLMAHGTYGYDFSRRPGSLPLGPMHMWFLYYLMLYCALAWALCKLPFPAVLRAGWASAWDVLTGRWWALPLLAIPLGLIGAQYPAGMVNINRDFTLNAGAFAYYGLFFVFGWTAYRSRASFVARLRGAYIACLAIGLVGFIALLALLSKLRSTPGLELPIAYMNGCVALLWSMGVIGLFVRFFPHQHRVLRYVADSSYWVFLVHMLGTMGFGVLLYHAPLGAGAKILINIAATTAACLITYQLFVRHTWIGTLLNGRSSEAVPVAALDAAASQRG